MSLPNSGGTHTLISGVDQEIVARTDELTETVQMVTESFPNLRADYRPNGADWYRWLIYDDLTSRVIGIVALGEPCEKALSLPDAKVFLRKRTLSLALQAT
jgi:hypothetical protein